MSEGCANRLAHFETPILCQESDLGRGKRIVLWQFKDTMVETFSEIFFESKEAEVEVKEVSACD